MDKDILKLLPQKAFKLLSIKETFKISALVTKSLIDKESYEKCFNARNKVWKFDEIKIVKDFPSSSIKLSTQEDGEKVLKIYFSQFFEKNICVHLDLRSSSFSSDDLFHWIPSKLHYSFSATFREGVCLLYKGFYLNNDLDYENGLKHLGIIRDSMSDEQKSNVKEIFLKHFGEGKTEAVRFSLEKLQSSFNAIFSFFLQEDIPLNPEFAVLGINLVTLYLTLQEIPHALNVSEVFKDVQRAYN